MFITTSHKQKLCSIILALALVRFSRAEDNSKDGGETEAAAVDGSATEAVIGEGEEYSTGEYDDYESTDAGEHQADLEREAKQVQDIFRKNPILKHDFLRKEMEKQQFQRYLQAIIVEAQNHNWARDDVRVKPKVLLTG